MQDGPDQIEGNFEDMTPDQLDKFWAWLKESGEIRKLNELLRTDPDIKAEWAKIQSAPQEQAPGRNEPCPCGSGKKYKKCCGGV